MGAGGLSLGGGLVAKVVNVFGAALGAEDLVDLVVDLDDAARSSGCDARTSPTASTNVATTSGTSRIAQR